MSSARPKEDSQGKVEEIAAESKEPKEVPCALLMHL